MLNIYLIVYLGIGTVMTCLHLIDIASSEEAFLTEEIDDRVTRVILLFQLALVYMVTAVLHGVLWPLTFIIRMRA